MWDKLSFRVKITVIFTACLIVLTVALTALSWMNAQQNISVPIARRLQVFGDSSVVLENDGDYYQSIFHMSDWKESFADFLTEAQLEELANRLTERSGVYTVDDLSEREHINLYSSDPLVAEGSGIFTVGDLLEQLDVAQDDFRQYSFWIIGAVIVLGTFGAYLVAGIVVHPIKALSSSVEGIEAEKLDVSLPIPKSHDEISQLTVSFNGMLDKLHRSFESKQLFAQNAAHELKTPLTIIRAHMQALKMDHEPIVEDYEEVLDEIYNNTERMIGLVEGLLAMGKSAAETHLTLFHGRELFERMLLDLKESIHAKHLNIQINGEVTFKGEKNLLPQAFFNLIHNAVRYNREGGSISVTMSENQIIIEDTGIGIPPESIEQLFDPFYCVDKSRSKKLGGNGLGLAITKNILDAHDMRIDITSEVGVGTTISIHL